MDMETVLSVELFENVLLHLPTRDLLLAQCVSRKWHNVICSSPDLQKALFFEPASASGAYVHNDLLAEVFPPWFRQYCAQNTISFTRKQGFERLPWIADLAKREAVMCEEASWRRMLVCQPAVSLVVRERHGGQTGTTYREARSELADSLRMGVLYDLTQDWIFGHLVSYFGIEWSTFPRPTKDDTVNYDEYMTRGAALAELGKINIEEPFEPTPWVTLDLFYVFQCTPDRGHDGRAFESKGRQETFLAFDEKGLWSDDPQVYQYFMNRRMLKRRNAS